MHGNQNTSVRTLKVFKLAVKLCHINVFIRYTFFYRIAKYIMMWTEAFSGKFLSKTKFWVYFSGYTATNFWFLKEEIKSNLNQN